MWKWLQHIIGSAFLTCETVLALPVWLLESLTQHVLLKVVGAQWVSAAIMEVILVRMVLKDKGKELWAKPAQGTSVYLVLTVCTASARLCLLQPEVTNRGISHGHTLEGWLN